MISISALSIMIKLDCVICMKFQAVRKIVM